MTGWLAWADAVPPRLREIVRWDPYRQECVPAIRLPATDPYVTVRVDQVFTNRWTGAIQIQGTVVADGTDT